MQGQYNIWKLTNVNHHWQNHLSIDRLNKSNWYGPLDRKIAFDKIQYQLIIKSS